MSTRTITTNANRNEQDEAVDVKLEAVLPVSDAERSKVFYESLGWRLDADFVFSETSRILQFTPTGSDASIIFGTGVTSATPGSVGGLLLAVSDIDAAHDDLLARGIDVSDVFHGVDSVFGSAERQPGAEKAHGEHEARTGAYDAEWPDWYATYLVAEQSGEELPA